MGIAFRTLRLGRGGGGGSRAQEGAAAREEDKPGWQKALEEQRRRRLERDSGDGGELPGGRSSRGHDDPGASAAAAGGALAAEADDPQAAAKAAARAASTGGRVESSAEWEKTMQDIGQRIVRDVTLVISPKHWLAVSRPHLDRLLEYTPEGVRILYYVPETVEEQDRQHLTDWAAQLPNLEIKDAGPFSSGFSMRNASVELVKTKYALFLFNDVLPAHKHWLHELYSFAEQRPEGVIFLPYVWQRQRVASAAHAAGGRGKAGRRAPPSSSTSRAQGADTQSSPLSAQPPLGSASEGSVTLSSAEGSVTAAHSPFAVDIVFDDFSNDGKLYVQRIEDSQVTGSRDPGLLEPRESTAAVEDHCLLVRQSLLEEALVFDPRAGWTRQDLDMALTVRYYNYRSFLVPQSQVVFLHPSLGLPRSPPAPTQLAYFVSQNNDDSCSLNQVHLRQKWGIVTGQLCRGFADSALRHVQWGSPELGALTQGQQLQLLLSFFSLLGMNRFQVRGLSTWEHPAPAPPWQCKSTTRDKDKDSYCQPVPDWMAKEASDFPTMVRKAPSLDTAFKQLQQASDEDRADSSKPELWVGRIELLLPLRVNRVEDLWRAASLREGQLFTVRRGTVKRGDKHPGRRAPELPYLMRMYLPFALIELELEISLQEMGALDNSRAMGSSAGQRAGALNIFGGAGRGGASGGAGPSSKGAGPSLGDLCIFDGMSIVLQEQCIVETPRDLSSEPQTGVNGSLGRDYGHLLHPKGRPCLRSSLYFRSYMFVRHTDMDQTPLRMFDKLRRAFQRSMLLGEEGWMEGRKMVTWLTPCFASTVRRMRVVRCVPGTNEPCALGIPLGYSSDQWNLVRWSWRPQSVRTAQVLLLQPGASRIVL